MLREYLDNFLAVYLDDLWIYSKSKEEYTQHVRLVLQKLKGDKLSLKVAKCEFDVTSVQVLGLLLAH